MEMETNESEQGASAASSANSLTSATTRKKKITTRISKEEKIFQKMIEEMKCMPLRQLQQLTVNRKTIGYLCEMVLRNLNIKVCQSLNKKLTKNLKQIFLRNGPSNAVRGGDRQNLHEILLEVSIHGLPKKLGIEDVPDQPEPQLAECLLPMLAWEEVLKYVGHMNTKNCAETCTLFQSILIPKKKEYMFESVLPFIFPLLEKDNVLTCRKVCKTWKFGIDSFLASHPSRRPFEESVGGRLSQQVFTQGVAEYNINNLVTGYGTRLVRRVEGHPSNPLISRSVRVLDYGRDVFRAKLSSDVFWEDVNSFIKEVGHNIHDFSFGCSVAAKDDKVGYAASFLKSMFFLMPNLRRLWLGGQLAALGTGFQKCWRSLPLATNLETLEIEDCQFWKSMDFFRFLMHNYHGQIKKLHLNMEHLKYFLSYKWCKLVELNIKWTGGTESLTPLFNINVPSLKKFGIALNHSSWTLYQCPEAASEFLELIVKVCTSPGLVALRLSGLVPFSDSVVSQIDQTLIVPPSLKILEVEHLTGLYTETKYALLKRFPFVKILRIFMRKKERGDPMYGERIRFSSDIKFKKVEDTETSSVRKERECELAQVSKNLFTFELYKTELWNWMPKLDMINFQGETFTREIWKEKQKSVSCMEVEDSIESEMEEVKLP